MEDNSITTYIEKNKARFVGSFPASFPVYVVHVEYDSLDSDPFYPLYKAILRYTMKDPKHENLSFFAYVAGFERTLIDSCIRHLKESGMIRWHQDHYVVTEDAEKKYLTANNRPTVRVSGSFLVDGKDLSLLPSTVYSSKRNFIRSNNEVSPHLPVDISMKIAPADKLVRDLEKGKIKDLLHLEASGTNFSIKGYDKRLQGGANVLFYIDTELKPHKKIIYNGEVIDCTALESPASYTIDLRNQDGVWEFKSNLGYNVNGRDDIESLLLSTHKEGLEFVVRNRYGLPDNSVIRFETEAGTSLPIIVLSENLLWLSQKPNTIIEDARREYADFQVKPRGMVRIAVNNNLQKYIDFINTIKEWLSGGRGSKGNGIKFQESLQSNFHNWREILILFKMFDALEAIDTECFILNRKKR